MACTVLQPSPHTHPIPNQPQSFPLESRAYPKLWDGAFSPGERYLQTEVADLVEFARLRGIRVVPEFDVVGFGGFDVDASVLLCTVCGRQLDMTNDSHPSHSILSTPTVKQPGHARSWCAGYPEVCPSAQCQQPLDPSNPFTLELVDGLIREVTGGGAKPGRGLFPDAFVHLGGDEVDTRCWNETAHVVEWMAAQVRASVCGNCVAALSRSRSLNALA